MERNAKNALVVMVDPLSSRIFIKCKIIAHLAERVSGKIKILYNLPNWQHMQQSLDTIAQVECLTEWDKQASKLSFSEKLWYFLDTFLESRIGFYPLALRFNLINSMNLSRLKKNHSNHFFDLKFKGILPNWKIVYHFMKWWTFSRMRFVDPRFKRILENECGVLIVTNPQNPMAIQLMLYARILKLPIICYIASWDHPVGKGVIFPFASLYLVQNQIMKHDLEKYHHISSERIRVTGWPQSDHFISSLKKDYFSLLRGFGINTERKVILYAGNTETNNPDECRFISRLVDWWKKDGRLNNIAIIFRPHPKDKSFENRYEAVYNNEGLFLQHPSYTDIDKLAVLLKNVDCVITNAGTIQIDSIANDRPTICVMYDENGGTSEFAKKNVQGEHYKIVLKSEAFYKAYCFKDVENFIYECLADPSRQRLERKTLTNLIFGEIDGKSAIRAVDYIVNEISSRNNCFM